MIVRIETGEKVERATCLIFKRYDLSEDDLSLDTLPGYHQRPGSCTLVVFYIWS
ncbi:hypothetical protein GO755_36875 [Spirosoma sp. HMF4905]|uniref:Uncharacterized protein n=1 Tax=Spirosoma arboris TaxID=2682092 RepID=A0A7K1SPB0_9BACT|nr:hypothetical protein [Spirosoma arboris]MVM35648.1 hypothetical protein [Spirosoma arboris]